MPDFIRGYIRAINPLAWQPGTEMRFDSLTIASNSPERSGKPYVQLSTVRCAVDVSMITVSALPAAITASLAASSGRQRNVTSERISISSLADGSLRCSSDIVRSSMSSLVASRSCIRRPVVPAPPSMNTVVFFVPIIFTSSVYVKIASA